MDNFKFSLIYKDDDKRGFLDGQVEKVGNLQKDKDHIDLFLEYIEKNFKSEPIFKALNRKHQPEIAAFLISRYRHIVLINTTKNVENMESVLYYFCQMKSQFFKNKVYLSSVGNWMVIQ
jgi:hypothetical protein